MKRLFQLCLVMLYVAIANSAYAGCGITTSTGIAFASYDVFSAVDNDAQGSITVICNIGAAPPNPRVNVTITISASPTSGSINPRQMRDPVSGDRLNYNVFTNAARTIVWSNNTASPNTIVLNNMRRNTAARTTQIYGRIFAGQDVSAGSYSDGATGLTVTITW
jgi:spore coat protein U-like protein